MPGWLNSTGSLKSMMDAGLLASRAAMPGRLALKEIPGQFGGSPFYGAIPWGMSPFDIQHLLLRQGYDAFREPPVKWKPPGVTVPPVKPPPDDDEGEDFNE